MNATATQNVTVLDLPFFDVKLGDTVLGSEVAKLFEQNPSLPGIMVMRHTQPDVPRPYRAWGYPVTPIIFAIVTLFCLWQNSSIHLRETLIGAATVLIGIPIYLWASRNVPVEQLRGETLPESSM